MFPEIFFLNVENVLQLHDDSLENEGGLRGLRDLALLQSAVAMPQQQFGGQFLHAGVSEMAAAYLFHIAANHPFLDGNKRAAAFSALSFLDLNGIEDLPDPLELERVTLAVADGTMGKDELTEWFQTQLNEKTAA